MNKRITVKDLARLCDVSIGTVDRALNGRGRINPDTKAKILAAARDHGYIKNQYAQTLSSGKSNLIGVIVLNLHNEYFPALLTGVDNEATARGYCTLFMSSDCSPEKEQSCIERLLSMNVAGIIVCSVQKDPSRCLRIAEAGTPIIAVSNRIGEGIPYTGIDDYTAMRDAARYILSRGWEHICYISTALAKADIQNISAQSERARGFRDAMAEADIPFDMVADKAAFAALTPPENKRTALLCSSDVYTQRCIVKFRERIDSGELGLMGFDNSESLRTLYPGLATVSYDACEIGREALRLLLEGGDNRLLPYAIIKGSTI